MSIFEFFIFEIKNVNAITWHLVIVKGLKLVELYYDYLMSLALIDSG